MISLKADDLLLQDLPSQGPYRIQPRHIIQVDNDSPSMLATYINSSW